MNDSLKWNHVMMVILVIIGIAALFSFESGKPVDAENISVDVSSVLILGG